MILKELDEQPIKNELHMDDGTIILAMTVQKAGTFIPQHSHPYSHTSYIAAGAVSVWKNEAWLGDFHAPAGLLIEANTQHLFKALRDNTTVLCIHQKALLKINDEPHFVTYEET